MANGALAQVDPQSIISRYLAGETTTEIASSLNVTRQGLGWHLRQSAEEQWKEAQIILAFERNETAEEALNAATDALSLARAREQLKSAQWDLERLLKRLYSTAQELTGRDGGPLTVEIVRYSEGRTIDSDSKDVAAHTAKLSTPDARGNSK